MFVPLLERSKVKNGKPMQGMVVEVWTSDDLLFLLRDHRRSGAMCRSSAGSTTRSRPSRGALAPNLRRPGRASGPAPQSAVQVIAKPLSVEPADPADAHPKARPIAC